MKARAAPRIHPRPSQLALLDNANLTSFPEPHFSSPVSTRSVSAASTPDTTLVDIPHIADCEVYITISTDAIILIEDYVPGDAITSDDINEPGDDIGMETESKIRDLAYYTEVDPYDNESISSTLSTIPDLHIPNTRTSTSTIHNGKYKETNTSSNNTSHLELNDQLKPPISFNFTKSSQESLNTMNIHNHRKLSVTSKHCLVCKKSLKEITSSQYFLNPIIYNKIICQKCIPQYDNYITILDHTELVYKFQLSLALKREKSIHNLNIRNSILIGNSNTNSINNNNNKFIFSDSLMTILRNLQSRPSFLNIQSQYYVDKNSNSNSKSCTPYSNLQESMEFMQRKFRWRWRVKGLIPKAMSQLDLRSRSLNI